jgi:hypothetical protein
MPTFPRTVVPRTVTPPLEPMAMLSVGFTGKTQSRSPLASGRVWEETFEALQYTNTTVRAWLAQVQAGFRLGTFWTVDHRMYLTANGPGGGTPLVNGASQTGNSIATDGWPNSTTVLKAGDLVKFGGLNLVYELQADATSNGSGQATLSIDPLILVAPADNAAVTYGASVTFRAVMEDFDPGTVGVNGIITGVKLRFREVP